MPNGIALKHNRKKLVIDGIGSTVPWSLFINNDLDAQMAYITNTGIAKFNGLIVNGTSTLTVDSTGVSVGCEFSYFYNNSLAGNAQILANLGIGPQYFNLSIGSNGLSRYISIRSNELKMSPILILAPDTTTIPLAIKKLIC